MAVIWKRYYVVSKILCADVWAWDTAWEDFGGKTPRDEAEGTYKEPAGWQGQKYVVVFSFFNLHWFHATPDYLFESVNYLFKWVKCW